MAGRLCLVLLFWSVVTGVRRFASVRQPTREEQPLAKASSGLGNKAWGKICSWGKITFGRGKSSDGKKTNEEGGPTGRCYTDELAQDATQGRGTGRYVLFLYCPFKCCFPRCQVFLELPLSALLSLHSDVSFCVELLLATQLLCCRRSEPAEAPGSRLKSKEAR